MEIKNEFGFTQEVDEKEKAAPAFSEGDIALNSALDLENVVGLLDSEPTEEVGYSNELDKSIMIDEKGVQWVTIRTAEKITGLSYSTINRYARNNRVVSKKQDMPTGGTITMVKLDDIYQIRDEKELAQTEREVKAGDYQINMTKVLRNAIEPSMKEIVSYLDKVESYQLQLISDMKDNNELARTTMGDLVTTVKELRQIVEQQSEKIDQQAAIIEKLQETSLAEKNKKKGFWSLFSKKEE